MNYLNFDDLFLYLIWVMLIWVCYQDIKYRIISNKIIIIFFCLILVWWLFGNGQLNYLGTVIFLIIGMALFYLKLIGAGDIKLIAVLLLSLPVKESWAFLIIMMLCGIPLALFFIVARLITHKKSSLPYGVAISAGYILVSAQHLS